MDHDERESGDILINNRPNAVRSDICDRFPALAWCNYAQTRLRNPSISVQQISDVNSADKSRYCSMYEKDFYNDCGAPIQTDFNRLKFCKAFFNYCDMAAKLAPLGKPILN
uniref:Uncharacterized protein n=1 Tax=Romanomermis culicivorax TaxID=13658 RepID=A0A915KRU5_ROMCU